MAPGATAASSRRTSRPRARSGCGCTWTTGRTTCPGSTTSSGCAPPTATRPSARLPASDSDDPLPKLLVERQPDGEVSEFLADVAEVATCSSCADRSGAGSSGTPHVPRPVPRRRHRGRASSRHGSHGAPARPHRPAAPSPRWAPPPPARLRPRAPSATERRSANFTRAPRRRPARRAVHDRASWRRCWEGVDLGYVCGSARFASYAEELLVAGGLDPAAIRVERFGPRGD